MKAVNKRQLNFFFLFLNLKMVLRKSAQKELAWVWQSKPSWSYRDRNWNRIVLNWPTSCSLSWRICFSSESSTSRALILAFILETYETNRKRNEKGHLGYVHTLPFVRTLRSHDDDYNLQRERQKAAGWIDKTEALHMHQAFFLYISLPFSYNITTGKFLISRFTEEVNKRQLNLFFLNLNMVLRNSVQNELAWVWQSKLVGVIAIEIERMQFHFLSDVFVTVAVVVSWSP